MSSPSIQPPGRPPVDPLLEAMRRQARRMVAEAFGTLPSEATAVATPTVAADGRSTGEAFTPSAELGESDEAFVLVVDLPGVAPDDVTVELRGRTVVVSGERTVTDPPGMLRWRTRRIGRFELVVDLPADADTDTLSVTVERGEVVVHVAKR